MKKKKTTKNIQKKVEHSHIVTNTSKKPTLEQRLEAFDPIKHGGEAMPWGLVGAEVFED